MSQTIGHPEPFAGAQGRLGEVSRAAGCFVASPFRVTGR